MYKTNYLAAIFIFLFGLSSLLAQNVPTIIVTNNKAFVVIDFFEEVSMMV